MKYLSLALLILLGVFFTGSPAGAAESDEGILVGRISHTEGTLLRYIEEEKDWVATVKDAPFGLEDALYSGDDTKAEFIMPNGTWMRIGENTQIQLIALNPDDTTVDVASGSARFYNKSRDTILKVTTPFGYVVAPGDTVFDLYVGDESLEVIAVRGDMDFVHDGTKAKYEVNEGSASIIADKREVAEGNGTVDAAWDDWNAQRDSVWARRLEARGDSVNYLPEPIREESYVLEENGRWERVYYEGEYHELWRPTRVDPDWRPFTAGRWTMYYGDNCWIPDEPFGYVTHHYGSWVYVESFGAWYWAPPVHRGRVGDPSVNISFGWYPGRVGWIHSGASVGWIPLAPTEVYYGYRHWGHRTVLVDRAEGVNINLGHYRYLDKAVIINRDNFYKGSRYTPHMERHLDRAALVKDYRPATSIKTFTPNKHRFAYNDAEVARKPHSSVISRIDTNQKRTREFNYRNKQGIERDLTRINTGTQPVQKTDIRTPRLRNKLVDADKVSKPIKEESFTQKEIKPKDRQRQLTRETPTGSDRPSRGRQGQGQVDQASGPTDQESPRRIRSPRDTGARGTEQTATETPAQPDGKHRAVRDQGQIDQAPGATDQEAPRRIRSPRDTGARGTEQTATETPAQPDGKHRAVRDQGQIDQASGATNQEAPRRIRSPRDTVSHDAGQTDNSQQPSKRQGTPDPGLTEQPKSSPGVSQETERKLDPSRKRQQEAGQRRLQQEQEVQKNQEQQQQNRQSEVQRNQEQQQQRQQVEAQGRQEQQQQQKQQMEAQRNQEQQQQRQQLEAQRRQEQQQQQKQQLEAQRNQEQQQQQQRQQVEAQRRQEQQQQQKQQLEAQRNQEQQQQRQQVEAQRRQEQQQQQKQQLEAQRNQEQQQQRQQVEAQRRQEQQQQQNQQLEAQRNQEQQQQRQQLEAQKRQEQQQQQEALKQQRGVQQKHPQKTPQEIEEEKKRLQQQQ